jgi:hypothetical protein
LRQERSTGDAVDPVGIARKSVSSSMRHSSMRVSAEPAFPSDKAVAPFRQHH